MDIKHKILGFYPDTCSILVNYYCDEVPDGFNYSIDLHPVNGQLPSQDEINELIKCFEPTGQLQRLVDAKNVQIPSHLADIVIQPQVPDQSNIEIPSPTDLMIEIQEAILNGKTVLNGVPISQDAISMFKAE